MTGQQALFFLYVKNRTIRRAVPVLVEKNSAKLSFSQGTTVCPADPAAEPRAH